MKKIVIGAAVALSLGAGAAFYALRDGENHGATAVVPAVPRAVVADSKTATAVLPTGFRTGLESLPGSLAGTEVDGVFEVDANGHLKITNGIRHIFDYFLSTVGEEPVDTIAARIRAYIRYRLKDPAATEAEKILDGYLQYKTALATLPPGQSAPAEGSYDLAAIRQQMAQVQALRSQFLSPEVIQAFFGDDDSYDRYTLERLQVLQDKSLSDAQRAEQLAALQQQLPVSTQAAMNNATQAQNLNALTEDWRQRGGSPDELRRIRESLVGPEAADRLEQLDRDNAAWDQRLANWFIQRDAVRSNPGLSESDREIQVARLRSDLFTEQERVRVQALESLHDSGRKLN